MPTITKIEGKKGISFKLTAYCGYDSTNKQMRKFKTWKPDKAMTSKQAEKEAIRQAQIFEDSVNNGFAAYDGTVKFEVYAQQWLGNAQIAPKTRERYVVLLRRVNEAIGNIKLQNVQAHHLEAFYKNLAEDGVKDNGRYAIANNFDELMKSKDIIQNKLSKIAGVAPATIGAVRSGKRINIESAEKIAIALNVPVKQIFKLSESTTGLSDRTILHHHRLISAILGKAKKERIIPYNVASEHTTAPKVRKKEAVYLDDKQAQQIVGLLLQEDDIRKKTALLLALYSGVRRGELCGLQWKDIDEQNKLIHVMRATQWQQGNGIVEVSTKNESSKRVIRLPELIFELLAEYRKYWVAQRLKYGSKWQGSDWIFIQDNGKPISPETLNFWINKFVDKHGLQHFTPHSLRHTFSTLQIMAGVNIRTIQARTGHAQASTLTNIYAHAIKTADELATEALDDILMPKMKSSKDDIV